MRYSLTNLTSIMMQSVKKEEEEEEKKKTFGSGLIKAVGVNILKR